MSGKINFCKSFLDKVAEKQGITNKLRYLLEDFFYEEGWMSKTNPKAMKEGYHQEFKYSKESIAHFIEDAVRLFQYEWDKGWKKVLKDSVKEDSKLNNIKKEIDYMIDEVYFNDEKAITVLKQVRLKFK